MLADLKANLGAFSISFDYMDDAVVSCTTGDAGATGFVERFAAMGAPWTYGIDDLASVAAEAGLRIADLATIDELHRTLRPDRPVASIIYAHYTVCTLTSAKP